MIKISLQGTVIEKSVLIESFYICDENRNFSNLKYKDPEKNKTYYSTVCLI